MNAASADWGSIPAWISAITPLILAGVLTRAMNRTANTIKEAVRTSRPRTLRERLRSAMNVRPGPDQNAGGNHSSGGSPHAGDYVDGSE